MSTKMSKKQKNVIRNADHHECQARRRSFNASDQVPLHKPCWPQGSSSKLQWTWRGPHEAIFVTSSTVYMIRKVGLRRGELLTVYYSHRPSWFGLTQPLKIVIMPKGLNMVKRINVIPHDVPRHTVRGHPKVSFRASRSNEQSSARLSVTLTTW